MKQKIKRTCVVIAGMHRSGTSALARVLNCLGCDLPKNLLGANPTNPTGHWESQVLVTLNDEILESAGSSWDDWTPCLPGWYQSPKMEEFKERAIEKFNDEFGSSRLMVFKDPRNCRILPFWIDILAEMDIQPLVMLPFRSPVEVATSLATRDESDEEYNLLAWLRNVLDAEYASRGLPRYFYLYDDLLTNWPGVIAKAEATLNIKWPRTSPRVSEEIDGFVSKRHRHHQVPVTQVLENPSYSPWVRDTFRILLKWNHSAGDEADFPILDTIRAELSASAETFAKLIYRGKLAQTGRWKLKHELAETSERLEWLTNANTAGDAARAQLEAENAQLRAELDGAHSEINSLTGVLTQQREHTEAERGAADQARSEADRLRAELDTATTETVELRHATVLGAQEAEAFAAFKEQVAHTCTEIYRLSHGIAREVAPLISTQAFLANGAASSFAALLETDASFDPLETTAFLEKTMNLFADAARSNRNHVDQLELSLSSASGEAASNIEAVLRLEGELSDKEAVLFELKRHIALLNDGHEADAKSLADSRTELDSKTLLIAKLQEHASDLESVAARVNGENESLSAEILNVERELNLARSALRQRSAETDDLHSEIEALSGQLARLNLDHDTSRDIAENLRKHVQLILSDLEDSSRALEQKAQAVSTLEARLAGELHERGQLHQAYDALATDSRQVAQQLVRLATHYRGRRLPYLWRLVAGNRAKELKTSGIVDENWYRSEYADVTKSGMDPHQHFVLFGAAEGRSPSPLIEKIKS